jgi:hypothetical protein
MKNNNKTKTPAKKLNLSRETLTTLTGRQLGGVAGGQDPTETYINTHTGHTSCLGSCHPPYSQC